MKVLVPLKRCPDADTRIRVREGAGGIVVEGVKHTINPFDAIALEEAVRIREKLSEVEIVAVSIGPEVCIEQLRLGLAMGADRAVLVSADQEWDSLGIAKVLAALARRERPDLILMGKQSIDDDSNQAGQMLAGLLRLPQATFVSRIQWLEANRVARCDRETDDGIETVDISLPAVITVDLRLNEPRYVSLPNILRAKKKPIETVFLADLAVQTAPRATIVHLAAPARRKAGVRLQTVDELLTKLRHEAKIL